MLIRTFISINNSEIFSRTLYLNKYLAVIHRLKYVDLAEPSVDSNIYGGKPERAIFTGERRRRGGGGGEELIIRQLSIYLK